MAPVTVILGAGTIASGSLAAAAGWSSPTGLAAFITALVGAGAFIWSVAQGIRKRREIDVAAAAALIEALNKDRHAD